MVFSALAQGSDNSSGRYPPKFAPRRFGKFQISSHFFWPLYLVFSSITRRNSSFQMQTIENEQLFSHDRSILDDKNGVLNINKKKSENPE